MSDTYAYYEGSPPGLPADSYYFGVGGLGVLGSEVPSFGEHGPGYMFASLDLPADANKEYYAPLGAIPAGLTLTVDEYSRVTASAGDGAYIVPATLYENGQPLGAFSFTYNFGTVGAVVNLAGAACVQSNSCSTAAVTVTPAVPGPKTINLVGAACVQANTSGVGVVSVTAGGAQAVGVSKVSAQRIVVFEGSGARLEFSQMTAKPAYKVGDKWLVDRDPDEESRYAADITDELSDRMTTAVPGEVELVLVGVASLADPALETVSINGAARTFVIAFLGPASGPVPAGWSWAARVRCANGELFDKTTYFNRKDG